MIAVVVLLLNVCVVVSCWGPLLPHHSHQNNNRPFLNPLRGSLSKSLFKTTPSSNDDNDDGIKDTWGEDDDDPSSTTSSSSQQRKKRTFLVCGDGDLSYSASIAQDLANQGISLVATVLEDQETHRSVYQHSQTHSEHVESFPNHKVKFSVDATNLTASFDIFDTTQTQRQASFDRIQFNFPHWRGKSNHKRNRELLSGFFASAVKVLSNNTSNNTTRNVDNSNHADDDNVGGGGGGEIHIALCEEQGGVTATTSEEYRQSWKIAQLAAEHGLLLKTVKVYQPAYDLSSHRGVDRPFPVGEKPELFIFGFPSSDFRCDERFQLCCWHELHVLLPDDDNDKDCVFSREDLVQGNVIRDLIQNLVPVGVRVEVPVRRVLSLPKKEADPKRSKGNNTAVVYLVVYCGEQVPLTRDLADGYRSDTENEVARYLRLRENRKGRLVSRPFHYPVLKPDELHWFSQSD